jgi:cell division protein FtsZ
VMVPRVAEPEKKRWGIFRSRRHEESRIEPAPRTQPAPSYAARTAPVQPRATAQAEPPRPQTPADLFGDQKRDDQFDIPTFLRKQTN